MLCILLLQKPYSASKSSNHVACLERRLVLWHAGDIPNLLMEGRTIQQRLCGRLPRPCDDLRLAHIFANLMFQGKTKAAIRLLTTQSKGGVLHLNDLLPSSDNATQTVRDVLIAKHPPGSPADPSILLPTDEGPTTVHPVLFDRIDAVAIRDAALRTEGAAGPSGIDASGWKRMCTSFQSSSNELCHSLALLARRLCTTFVDTKGLAPLLACRLVALDKNPGVRPIGIGEAARRIIAKTILHVTREDIQQAAGSLQLCAGQMAGAEAAIHGMNLAFHDQGSDAVLLVDAINAFIYSIDRQLFITSDIYALP